MTQIWWQENSQALAYLSRSGEVGKYDYSNSIVIPDSNLINPYTFIPDQIQQIIQNQVDYDYVQISPSFQRVLYWIPRYKSPTPTPQMIGEPSGNPENIADIFWTSVASVDPVFLIQIEGIIHSFHWSPNEEWVVIGVGEPLRINRFLLVNLNQSTVNEIQLEYQFGRDAHPLGFIPNGKTFMFTIGNKVILKNLFSDTESELTIPLPQYLWWVSDHEFIALIKNNITSIPSKLNVFLYDIRTNDLRQISDCPVKNLANYFPHSILLSPDKTKIGYIDQEYYMNVIQLCPEYIK